jgi:hypothetical protein
LLKFKVSSVGESFKEDDDELVLRAQGEWKDGVKSKKIGDLQMGH